MSVDDASEECKKDAGTEFFIDFISAPKCKAKPAAAACPEPNPRGTTPGGDAHDASDDSDVDDDDLVVLSLNHKHRNVQMLKDAMGFDASIIKQAWASLKADAATKAITPRDDNFMMHMIDVITRLQSGT